MHLCIQLTFSLFHYLFCRFRSSKKASYSSEIQVNEEAVPKHLALPHLMRLHPTLHTGVVLGTAGQSSLTAITRQFINFKCALFATSKRILNIGPTLQVQMYKFCFPRVLLAESSSFIVCIQYKS